ncbi:MAG: TIM barrel protein [Candidatus Latescibacterota bacterium]|nr:TIM barrel protein [Candidatus Latescibacterota bacterium]
MANRSDEVAELNLLEMPAAAAMHGIHTLELCHFHFPSVDASYLDQLRRAVVDAEAELFSILVDTGDISHADPGVRATDMATIRGWIDIAAELEAGHVRIIAGDSDPGTNAIERSVSGLLELAAYAEARGVATLTENFKQLAARPETCIRILNRCEGRVGLCADFGNFPVPTRSQDLTQILPRAASVHAKAEYRSGVMERQDYLVHVGLAASADFDGPISLICQDADDVWGRILELKKATEEAWVSRELGESQ